MKSCDIKFQDLICGILYEHPINEQDKIKAIKVLIDNLDESKSIDKLYKYIKELHKIEHSSVS